MKLSLRSLLCPLLLAVLPAAAQTGAGSWEFSLAGNLGSTATSNEYSSAGNTFSSDGEAHTYFGLDLRAGAYLLDGFSLEPEIYLLAFKGVTPTLSLGGNLAYTFTIPESPVKPFVTAGYGVGNGIPFMQRMLNKASSDLDVPVLRAGGGIKILLSKSVALKAEYRYERYSQEETHGSGFYFSTSKMVATYHNVLFGFSVFLPSSD